MFSSYHLVSLIGRAVLNTYNGTFYRGVLEETQSREEVNLQQAILAAKHLSQTLSISLGLYSVGNDQAKPPSSGTQKLQVTFKERHKQVPTLIYQSVDTKVRDFTTIK